MARTSSESGFTDWKFTAPLPLAELCSLLNRDGDAIAAPGPLPPWW
jgi:hypothetical protein